MIGRNVLKPEITVTSDTSRVEIFKSLDEHSSELNNLTRVENVDTLKSIEKKSIYIHYEDLDEKK